MSYAALALRLAAVEALCPTKSIAENKPFPTDAGKLVYDSRLRPLDANEAAHNKAGIFVYTDDAALSSGAGHGGPPFRAVVDLVLVLIIAGPAAKEAQTEARLDALEGQAFATLFYGPSGSIWRRLTDSRVAKAEVETERSAEEHAVILIRTLRLACQVPFDCVDLNPSTVPVGADRIPEPLKGVLASLASTAYGKQIGLSLQNGAPVMPVLPSFETMDMGIDAHSPADGAADVSLAIDIPQT